MADESQAENPPPSPAAVMLAELYQAARDQLEQTKLLRDATVDLVDVVKEVLASQRRQGELIASLRADVLKVLAKGEPHAK